MVDTYTFKVGSYLETLFSNIVFLNNTITMNYINYTNLSVYILISIFVAIVRAAIMTNSPNNLVKFSSKWFYIVIMSLPYAATSKLNPLFSNP